MLNNHRPHGNLAANLLSYRTVGLAGEEGGVEEVEGAFSFWCGSVGGAEESAGHQREISESLEGCVVHGTRM